MKTRITYLLLVLLIPITQILANNDSNTISFIEPTDKIENLENLLEGEIIGNALMVGFNISQVEFNSLITQNNITQLSIDFFWKNHAGDTILPVGTDTIKNITTITNIENWTYPITPIDTTGFYLAQVAINDATCGPRVEIPIVEHVIEEEDPIILIGEDTVKFYNCGDIVDLPEPDPDNLLQLDDLGAFFTIAGFPIYLNDDILGGNGKYSGTGIIPLPFNKTVVKVFFSDITVDKNHTVIAGIVEAERDNPSLYPDFDVAVGSLNIGGDICQEIPVETIDVSQYGFDPVTGLHANGTIYDDKGYYVGTDAEGSTVLLHKDTDTPFNKCGCNIDGTGGTYEGIEYECQPACNSNEAAVAFAESIKNTIGDSIAATIVELKEEVQEKLDLLDCDTIRQKMRDLVDFLKYDELFIFGVDEKYLKKGMYLEFETQPRSLIANIERTEEAKELEDKHVELYECDKLLHQLEAALVALESLENNSSLSDDILAKIKEWSQTESDKYINDSAAFKEWLKQEIDALKKGITDLNGMTDSTPSSFQKENGSSSWSPRERWGHTPTNQPKTKKDLNELFQFDRGFAAHQMTASVDNPSIFNESFTLEDAAFEFMQGREWINGVERVYYLEEIVRQQYFNPTERSKNKQPIVIEKQSEENNRTIAIYLDDIVFRPSGATLNAYALFEDPESGKKFAFSAVGVSFGPGGLTGEASLSMRTDVQIRLNNSAMLVIEGTDSTNVVWDCDGFKSMSIDAYVEFCRNRIIPVDPTTGDTIQDPEVRYRLDFDIQKITSWLEFHFSANAQPFVVRHAPNIQWQATNMLLDFSSTETPKFKPLSGYASPFYDTTTMVMAPGWKGFYIEELSATLKTTDFNVANNTASVTSGIIANDLLIDGNGFTGGIKYKGDILSIDNGNIGGWAFSIEEIGVRVLNNRLNGGEMAGVVNVPIFEENLGYEAVIYPGDQYSFTVSVDTTVSSPVFLADVELNKESKVQIGKINGEFVAKATLSGRLEIDVSKNDNTNLILGFPKLCFQKFEVSNKAPYFSPGIWGIVDDKSSTPTPKPDISGFGIKLDSIVPYSPGEKKVGLGFNLGVILNNKFDITAEGRFGLEGRLEEPDGRQKWVYDKFKISKLAVDASFSDNRIKGLVEWFDSGNGGGGGGVNWGKGFRGALEAEFSKTGIKIQAVAQFGKLQDYKYFYVDALVQPSKLLSASSGFIQLRGFGGGVAYHMNINPGAVSFIDVPGEENNDFPDIGETFSGSVYTPTDTIGLSLKATVLIAAGSDHLFNGTVSFLVSFNEGAGNGINKIALQGSGQMLKKLDLSILPKFLKNAKTPPTVDAPLSCYIDLRYNFGEPSFHGYLNVFLETKNGTLRGAGTNNQLVNATIHFDPNKWYIHVGRPQKGSRAGAILQIPGLGEGLHADAYFQAGTQTDPMPPLPSKVREIAYSINDNKSLRSAGAGFVFGFSVGAKMEADIIGVVSGELEAEIGSDLMLRKYTDVSCVDTGSPIGINGWYAVGQVYAYAYGKLEAFGINVAEAGIAAVVQFRGPNPAFFQGTVALKLKALGIVEFDPSLSLTLGSDCRLVANDPSDVLGMDIITSMNPSDGQSGVETNVQPIVTFAIPLKRTYKIIDLNGTEVSYNITLLETKLTDSEGLPISHKTIYFNKNSAIRLIPNNVLPANDSINFEVTVKVGRDDNFFTEESKSVTFATDDFLGYIPESNIEAAYPANGMVNFYRNELNTQEGSIKLISGQPELFHNLPEGVSQKIRLTGANGGESLLDFTYADTSNLITFPLSAGQLTLGDFYKLEIIQIGGGNSVPNGEGDGPFDPNFNSPVSTPSQGIIYDLYFRVSNYETFSAKIEEITNSIPMDLPSKFGRVMQLSVDENFGNMEVNGNSKYDPLIDFEIDLNSNWIQTDVKNHFDELDELIFCVEELPSINDLANSIGLNNPAPEMEQNQFESGAQDNLGHQLLSFELEKQVEQFSQERKAIIIECGGGSQGSLVADCIDAGGSDAQCEAFLAQTQATYDPLPDGDTFTVWVTYSLPNGIVTTTKEISFSN